MRVLLLAGLALAALSGTAQAQRFTVLNGAKLVEMCGARDRVAVQSCEAYIDGIADTVAFYQRLRPMTGDNKLPAYMCLPASLTGPQLRQTVVSWAEQHRDQLNRQASGIVLRAFDAAYLCPGEQRHVPEGEK